MARQAKAKTDDIDFFKDLLPAITKKDEAWWDGLTEEQQRKFNAWITMRWLSNVEDELQTYWLIAVNEKVNKHFSSIKTSDGQHNKLLFQLMCSVFDGHRPRVKWVAPAQKSKNIKEGLLLKMFPNYKMDDIITLAEVITQDELEELAREHGIPEDEQ
jgi:hypothetical protein